MRDLRPTLDLAHRHNVDAVLIVADGEADELGWRRGGARRLRGGPFSHVGWSDRDCGRRNCLTHVPMPPLPPPPKKRRHANTLAGTPAILARVRSVTVHRDGHGYLPVQHAGWRFCNG